MDAIGPEVGAAHQYQHPDRPLLRPGQGFAQALALRGRHRAVVELEMEEACATAFLIRYVLPGFAFDSPPVIQRRVGKRGRRCGKRQCCREFEIASAFGMADPQRAIAGSSQQGAFAPCQQVAGLAVRRTTQGRLGPRIENMRRFIEQAVGDTGEAVGGIDLSQHGGRVVALPVDDAIRLLHQRPRPPTYIHALALRRRQETACNKSLHRLQHGTGCGLRDLVAVNARLLGATQRKHGTGPDRPGVHFGICLQHRDAPLGLALLYRPVQRRRPAVADNARMHNQANVSRPDRFGNRPAQIRRHDQLRLEHRHGFLGDAVGDVELDGNLVPAPLQFRPEALRQAVESVGEEQNSHGICGINKFAAVGRPPANRRCGDRRRPW